MYKEMCHHQVSKYSLLIAFVVVIATASTSTYFIKPNVGDLCPGQNSTFCTTLSKYANDSFNSFTDNITLVLLPGDHRLDVLLLITNTIHLHVFAGATSTLLSQDSTSISCDPISGFLLQNIGTVHISDIMLVGCLISIVNVDEFTLENCTFSGQGRNRTGLEIRWTRAQITHSSFYFNTAAVNEFFTEAVWGNTSVGGAIVLHHSNASITTCVFENNWSHFLGGAIGLLNSTVAIRETTFINNTAGTYGGAIESYNGCNIILENVTFVNNTADFGGAMGMGNSTTLISFGILNFLNNKYSAIHSYRSSVYLSGNTTFSNNYGSFYAISSNVTLAGLTTIETNMLSSLYTGTGSGAVGVDAKCNFYLSGKVIIMHNTGFVGGALLIVDSSVYVDVQDLTIVNNTGLASGGGIYAYQSELYLKGNVIIENNHASETGGAIHATSTSITLLDGSLILSGNNASKGGGMFLELNAKLYVLKTTGPTSDSCHHNSLEITHNSADYGGGFYVADETYSGALCDSRNTLTDQFNTKKWFITSLPFDPYECFFQPYALFPCLSPSHVDFPVVNIAHNKAAVNGRALFGGLLDRCTIGVKAKYALNQNFLNFIDYLIASTNLDRHDLWSEVSSSPVRVCLCVSGQPNCSYEPPPQYVAKGAVFTISLVAVDQVNNTVPNTTIYSTLLSEAGLGEGQSVQYTKEDCTDLKYTVLSPSNDEQLHIYVDGPCKNIGISVTSIEVQFKQCPAGFTEINLECNCDELLVEQNVISNCSIDDETVTRTGNTWISYINTSNSEGFIIQTYCPFDYCVSGDVAINFNLPNGEDSLCAFNRTGLLCGRCKTNFSLSLGSSNCVSCSNDWLMLLIPFALAGIALVVFLMVFNLTVVVGTINGLILYANIVSANHAIYIPFQRPNALTIFIAWLNLDYGFETCFYDGMDSYAKAWLQLVFPAYIFTLVFVIIIISRHSRKFSELISIRNPIALLDTLILLSYAKLLRTVIYAISNVRLEYPYGSGNVLSVWRFDANIEYLKGKHIPLFIAGILILIVGSIFTLLLFLWQWILHFSNNCILKKIARPYVKTLMDPFHAPHKLKHRYWTGLLLLVRVILYPLSTLNVFTNPSDTVLCILCVVGILQLLSRFNGKIYKNFIVDVLEYSFIFNLFIFSAAVYKVKRTNSLYDDEIVAYSSISFAFVTFIGILLYHLYQFMSPKKIMETLHIHLPQLQSGLRDNITESRPIITRYEDSSPQECSEPRPEETVIDGTPPIMLTLSQSHKSYQKGEKLSLSSQKQLNIDYNTCT